MEKSSDLWSQRCDRFKACEVKDGRHSVSQTSVQALPQFLHAGLRAIAADDGASTGNTESSWGDESQSNGIERRTIRDLWKETSRSSPKSHRTKGSRFSGFGLTISPSSLWVTSLEGTASLPQSRGRHKAFQANLSTISSIVAGRLLSTGTASTGSAGGAA